MIREFADLGDEADELYRLLKSLNGADWRRPARFKAWTVDDIVRHLRPHMGVATFTAARQMETGAHGQAIYDLFGVDRPPPSPRLCSIAELGVRTFGWASRRRQRARAIKPAATRLGAPDIR